jgi:hypothetical protein
VTWKDIVRIARAAAHRSHDQRYDLNGDGRVGFRDLKLALFQLGRRCSR